MALAPGRTDLQTALIDIDRAGEFSGDDVDQYSKLVDLGMEFNKLLIELPAMTSSTISIYVQRAAAVDTVPKIVHRMRRNAATSEAWTTTASAGSLVIVCDQIGSVRYVRIKANTNQAADRAVLIGGLL